MEILVIGIIAVLLLLLLPKLLGGKQERILSQYEILEKRFGLEHRFTKSKWGKGLGEHHRLDGNYHGYPVSFYSHYHQTGKRRQLWTSLVLETLFAGELEFDLELENVDREARYPEKDYPFATGVDGGVQFQANRSEAELKGLFSEAALRRIKELAKAEASGAFRLSKGFLEYRESGELLEDSKRERFQTAFLILGELADGIAEVVRAQTTRS